MATTSNSDQIPVYVSGDKEWTTITLYRAPQGLIESRKLALESQQTKDEARIRKGGEVSKNAPDEESRSMSEQEEAGNENEEAVLGLDGLFSGAKEKTSSLEIRE